MLKIEVIKFEAQDIITNSGTPVAPEQKPVCICGEATYENGHMGEGAGVHTVGNRICPYPHVEGDCEIN